MRLISPSSKSLSEIIVNRSKLNVLSIIKIKYVLKFELQFSNKLMEAYQNLLRHVYQNGVVKSDRTGVGTKSVFGYQMKFDLAQGFPLVTTKTTSKVHYL